MIGESTIKKCDNRANISITKNPQTTNNLTRYSIETIAGICADISLSGDYQCKIEECNNFGQISSDSMLVTGGIVGCFSNAGEKYLTIKDCNNYGKILGNGSIAMAGGIIAHGHKTNIENCGNYGQINVNNNAYNDPLYLGGIAGYSNGNLNVYNSFNNGEIIAKSKGDLSVGGIYGREHTGYAACIYNRGDIKGSSKNSSIKLSGVIGFAISAYNTCLYNTGTLTVMDDNTGSINVGGVIANCYNMQDANNAYNFGRIVVPSHSNSIGGTFGTRTNSNNTSITDFYYENGVYSGSLYDSSVATGVDTIDKTAMESRMNTAVAAFNTNYAETAGVTAKTWSIDTNKNNGYPILNEQ